MEITSKMATCSKCGESNLLESKFCNQCGTQLGITAEVTNTEIVPANTSFKYAGFWIRFIALIVDVILLIIVCFALALLIATAYDSIYAKNNLYDENARTSTVPVFDFLIYIIGPWLWFTIYESSRWQATPGKMLFGLKITNENGERIGFGRANIRFWSKYLISGWLFIGFIIAGLTAKKQSLHDLLARTLVVKLNQS